MLSKQHGLTLLELMLALALSLFLILVVAQFFVSGKSSYRTHQAEAELQDRGRYALNWLGQQLRQAGYVDVSHIKHAGSQFAAAQPFAAGDIIHATASSSLSLRYWGGDAPVLLNCLGAPAPVASMVSNTIDVADAYLRCDAVPVLPGVLQLAFTYGADQDGDRIPDSYQSKPLDDWSKLRTVRVCLLLQSISERVTPWPQTVSDCNNAVYQPLAGRIVRRFETTVFLRNAGTGT